MKDSFASVSAARWLTALAMMSGAAPAMACPPSEDDSSEGVEMLRVVPGVQIQAHGTPVRGLPILKDLPLIAIGNHGESLWDDDVQTNITMSHAVDGKSYEVQIKDGKTTAKIDGKELPDSQIRVSDDQVELLDAKGDVVHTFPKGMKTTMRWKARINDGGAMTMPAFPSGRLRLEATQPAVGTMPPVMMGITMSEAADQSGLGVVVDKVIEGLPAFKAGLRMGDKILEVNGTDVEDVLSFREFLSERKAGEEITLKVLRDTTPRDVKVTLEAFSEEALKPFMIELEASAPQAIAAATPRNDAAKIAIEKAMESLKNSKMSDEARNAALETLRKALTDIDTAKAHEGAWVTAPNRRLYERDRQGSYVVTPAPARAPLAAAHAEELDAKIELLTLRLEKALAMIENQQGKATASPETLDKVKAQLLKLQQENEALRKKVEELQTKRGGN